MKNPSRTFITGFINCVKSNVSTVETLIKGAIRLPFEYIYNLVMGTIRARIHL